MQSLQGPSSLLGQKAALQADTAVNAAEGRKDSAANRACPKSELLWVPEAAQGVTHRSLQCSAHSSCLSCFSNSLSSSPMEEKLMYSMAQLTETNGSRRSLVTGVSSKETYIFNKQRVAQSSAFEPFLGSPSLCASSAVCAHLSNQ